MHTNRVRGTCTSGGPLDFPPPSPGTIAGSGLIAHATPRMMLFGAHTHTARRLSHGVRLSHGTAQRSRPLHLLFGTANTPHPDKKGKGGEEDNLSGKGPSGSGSSQHDAQDAPRPLQDSAQVAPLPLQDHAQDAPLPLASSSQDSSPPEEFNFEVLD